MANPLQKYYRQPKIYLSLPSGGHYYPQGALSGDPTNLAVFGMSAMDEIMMKTPDALFSGESVVSAIRSCIPDIIDPWHMPQLDIDATLVALRIATYGQTLETKFKCKECGEDNIFELDLTRILDYFSSLEYNSRVIVGPLVVNIRPLTYKETTEMSMKSYQLRRQLYQGADAKTSEEEKNKILDTVYKKIATLTVEVFKRAITSIEVEDEVVEDQTYISEWIQNSDREFFDKVKEHIEKLKDTWRIQPQKVDCQSCGEENTVAINLDNSDFFVRR